MMIHIQTARILGEMIKVRVGQIRVVQEKNVGERQKDVDLDYNKNTHWEGRSFSESNSIPVASPKMNLRSSYPGAIVSSQEFTNSGSLISIPERISSPFITTPSAIALHQLGNSDQFPTHSQLLSLQILRDTVIDWLDHPNFDQYILGCFVKISSPSPNRQMRYRVGRISYVQKTPNYYSISQTKKTNKIVGICFGDRLEGSEQMIYISNSLITAQEFEVWKKENQTSFTETDLNNKLAELESGGRNQTDDRIGWDQS